MRRILSLALLFAFTAFPTARAADRFELLDGDRVLFIGDTLIERAQEYGYIERNLTAQFPDRHVTFRNLGWSADTPEGQSRVSFDWSKPPQAWFENLTNQIAFVRPTVAFVGYGMASSFAGPDQVETFEKQLARLAQSIRQINPQVRLIFLGTIQHEALGAPLPDPAPHNALLALYNEAIERVAQKHGGRYISLFNLSSPDDAAPCTDNGIHLTNFGYQKAAQAIERGLGLQPLDISTPTRKAGAEALRQAILKKNELFFHRWRPQNTTYLFLFRKHEQGQNAKEIPMFDPLIEAQEERIAQLRHLSSPPDALPSPVITPHDPQWSLATQPVPQFEIDPAFEISLWAQNPLLAKPIHMNFDPQGRLWVASSSVYPQIEPGQAADDKIVVLQDTDGDGVAEKSTVFTGGLLIPTGVAPGDGGVYVGQSTKLLHFKDTDGDGRADQERIVLSGFGTEDTHHILHSLRWGYDGQLYMNQSIYIHTHTETPHGVVRLNSGGILNLEPDSMRLGIFLRGLCNSWGHHFDRWGQSFATDGAGFSGINHVVPGAMYFTYAGARRLIDGVSPGSYPKFSGLELIYSPQFPDDWQGHMITCDFRANRVVRFSIADRGAAYVTREEPTFLRSTNVTFRPIDAKMGPDGALYIADWSNPIIQHGEVDFRDQRRDHVHGRIWRVAAKDRPLQKVEDLTQLDTDQLLNKMLSPSGYTRESARRVLTERGKSVLPTLNDWAAAQSEEQLKLEALWLFQSLHHPQPQLLHELLAATEGKVRAAAVRVLTRWLEHLDNPLLTVAARIDDPHPRVRLEALRALPHLPSAQAAELALSVLQHPMDSHLDYALWLTINELAEPWLQALASGDWPAAGREQQLEFALNALPPDQAARAIAPLQATHPIPADGAGFWLPLLEKAGNPQHLQELLEHAAGGYFDRNGTDQALAALAAAAANRQASPPQPLAPVRHLLQEPQPEPILRKAVQLAGHYHLDPLSDDLLTLVKTVSTPAGLRQDALNALAQLGGENVVQDLLPFTSSDFPTPVRSQTAAALARINLKSSLPAVLQVLGSLRQEEAALSLWRDVLQVKGADRLLAEGLRDHSLTVPSGKAGLRASREGGRSNPELILAVTRSANLEDEENNLSPDEIRTLAARILEEGDAARGEFVYRRAELACVSCHAIGGVGGKVGPDLTSIGASAPMDYLIESLLYPNRKIKEGYHAMSLETSDGLEYTGTLARETDNQYILLNAANQEVAVAKNTVENKRISQFSLMPSGLLQGLNRQEEADLYMFLSQLGKSGAFDASKADVARVWYLYADTLDAQQFEPKQIIQSDLTSRGWSPASTLVDGRLLKAELEAKLKSIAWRNPNSVYAAAEIDIPKDDAVQWQLEGNVQHLWIDGREIPLQPGQGTFTTPLAAGRHRVVVKLPKETLPDHLRLHTNAGTFLTQ